MIGHGYGGVSREFRLVEREAVPRLCELASHPESCLRAVGIDVAPLSNAVMIGRVLKFWEAEMKPACGTIRASLAAVLFHRSFFVMIRGVESG